MQYKYSTKEKKQYKMKLINDTTKEKLRGGFYTPAPIVNFILKWAINGNKHYSILEPSCGDGIFLRQMKENKFEYDKITAIEMESEEVEKIKRIHLKDLKTLNCDFYYFCNRTAEKFDLVIGNPPYIRYQYFNKVQREEAEKIFIKAGLKYSKLTNAWVSFIVGSCILLKDKGKLAFVVPAEILQVSYAKQLRNYLAYSFNKISIVSFRKLVFPSIQQEVVLLFCERTENHDHLIEHIEVKDAEYLINLDVNKLRAPQKKVDFKSNKWTFYFLSQNEINFIEGLINEKQILPLRTYATVEVGMTTGSNYFFTVPTSIINQYGLSEYANPLVGRSVQVSGAIFTEKDWKLNSENEAKSHILLFPKKKKINNSLVLKYIEKGESENIHKGFKCGIREEWQIIPSAWISDALFLRRNNIYPKFVINEAKAYTTDTMHRVTIAKDKKLESGEVIDLNALVASYYNSLSLAFAEICGRSHGGGVLELMPNEVENILIPYKRTNSNLLIKIDQMMREGKNIEEILSFTNQIILKDGYGFSERHIKIADSIWKKLLNRRMNRAK
ncbi:modification methyltransferase [Candidatus Magnetoovum chiemensis]|nr:modification methyltransferase [Candidatus Magnetoovum chiemensis]